MVSSKRRLIENSVRQLQFKPMRWVSIYELYLLKFE